MNLPVHMCMPSHTNRLLHRIETSLIRMTRWHMLLARFSVGLSTCGAFDSLGLICNCMHSLHGRHNKTGSGSDNLHLDPGSAEAIETKLVILIGKLFIADPAVDSLLPNEFIQWCSFAIDSLNTRVLYHCNGFDRENGTEPRYHAANMFRYEMCMPNNIMAKLCLWSSVLAGMLIHCSLIFGIRLDGKLSSRSHASGDYVITWSEAWFTAIMLINVTLVVFSQLTTFDIINLHSFLSVKFTKTYFLHFFF